jgi:tRNA nucleotidyltransferase (CCA-adding enzyme)
VPLVPLAESLTASDFALLNALGASASRAGTRLWLVGGSVRDALLGHPMLDLDITSETSAAILAPVLARDLNGSVSARSQFDTIKLRIDGRSVDLATARSERYPRPGALPTVSAAGVTADLARRDFSVNAMAVSLAPDSFGEMLDTQHGLDDLRQGVIRILHGASFQDDATRILRAVRYATRLGFTIDRATSNRLRRDLAFVGTISAPRIRREMERALSEPFAARVLLAMARRGVLGAVHPSLAGQDALGRAARAKLSGLAVLGALVYPLPAEQATAVAKRIGMTSRQAAVVRNVHRIRDGSHSLAHANAKPSEVDQAVGGAPLAAIEACAAVSEDQFVRAALRRYSKLIRSLRMPLDGHAIRSLGITDGPVIGAMLADVRSAILDGSIRSRRSARLFVKKRIEE